MEKIERPTQAAPARKMENWRRDRGPKRSEVSFGGVVVDLWSRDGESEDGAITVAS